MSGFALRRNLGLQLPTSFVEIESNEMEYIDGGGFIGFRVHFSKKVQNMGAVAGGAFVGGVVGFACKSLAATGPIGAGAAATISAVAGGVAGNAIRKGLSAVNIGVHANGVKSNIKHLYV
ncbi:hypothetical protein [Paraclostridium bifermentans]|uniref:hypothetical protein n=1 Tax=Paraclostridium bifermentans TaxID=1490 RepID=UPI0011DDAD64|nr:hypothetical protein [Paraclostridium bifermentans]